MGAEFIEFTDGSDTYLINVNQICWIEHVAGSDNRAIRTPDKTWTVPNKQFLLYDAIIREKTIKPK